MNTVEQIEYRGLTIKIYQEHDSHPDLNPRSWGNLGRMICWHRRYNLGDEGESKEFRTRDSFAEWRTNNSKDIAVIIPLRMYEHGNIGISTSADRYPYNCPWDSGWVGYIYVTKDDLRKEYNVQRVSKKLIDKADRILRQEVEIYDLYISGDVWWYSVDDPITDESVDSCSGFYGSNWEENGLLEHARDGIDSYISRLEMNYKDELAHELHKHAKKLKAWIKGKVPLIYREPFVVPGRPLLLSEA